MQSIFIEDRKNLVLTGATKIVSSTDTQAVVELSENTLIITGSSLEITKLNLDNQEVSFTGTINSVKFSQKAEKKSLFKRLFK